MSDIVSLPYKSDYLSACLAIFDSNVPAFFAPEERLEFCEHLEGVNGTTALYLVLMRDGIVLACGGLTTDETRQKASLSWGMVDRKLHGQRLGTHLMQARLTLARSKPGLAELVLSTSQHTHAFYERFGFTVSKITPRGFGPALDRCDMHLRLLEPDGGGQ
ncbi:GNAT family N-acetyltransferase [Rhizobium nepotum]|uniref:GNAT family N-acetyltransferase n=1 Tax=Rhizobium nepotum TaxID=1035271 RepID=UPI00336ACD9F